MRRFIRLFSRIWKRNENKPVYNQVEEIYRPSVGSTKNKSTDIECRVKYLDSKEPVFYLPKNAKASVLYDFVITDINLNEEKEYFALKCSDSSMAWIDPTKSLRKQCSGPPPYRFNFCVKFFSSDPHQLCDEYARYLFVLQIREDIRYGRLSLPDKYVATQLFALLLQGEFGDYDQTQHSPLFISTFRFMPDEQLTDTFEYDVIEEYRKLKGRKLTPEIVDQMFLDKVRFLSDYGVDMHEVMGKDNKMYSLGLTPSGILLFEGKEKIGLFIWPAIVKMEMSGSKLKLVATETDEFSNPIVNHKFVFILRNARSCKHLWKCAIEYHAFFRLTDRIKPPSKLKQFFRLKSRFYASFRTEYQLHKESSFGSSSIRHRPTLDAGVEGNDKPSRGLIRAQTFHRMPSRRYTARTSSLRLPATTDYNDIRDLRRPLLPSGHTSLTTAVVETPSKSSAPLPTANDLRQRFNQGLLEHCVEYTV